MILTDSMLEAAFDFRKTEIWNSLNDSNIFAVRLHNGETVYCSIMGNGGEHYSLGIYIGEEGFSSYLRFLNGDGSMINNLRNVTKADCINCDFMQAKEIDNKVKKIIRQYAESHGISIPRKHGWVDFTRHKPYKGQWCITNTDDAIIAEEALRASTYLANEIINKGYEEVGLAPNWDYPTNKGGKTIPLIVHDDNGYSILSTQTPALKDIEYVSPIFNNDILAHNIASMNKTGTILCRMEHIPNPIMQEDNEQPSMPGMFIMLNQSDGEMLPPYTTFDYPDNTQMLLSQLANHFCMLGIHPKQIIVSDKLTFALISDFCSKCDIKLTIVDSMPELDYACDCMAQYMMEL